jgi:hypothetical protein
VGGERKAVAMVLRKFNFISRTNDSDGVVKTVYGSQCAHIGIIFARYFP